MEQESPRRYDREFKDAAVRQVTEGGRRICDVARGLGIPDKNLSRWKREFEKGNGVPSSGDAPTGEEMRLLRKKLADVTMERDILKKAVAVFSRDPQ